MSQYKRLTGIVLQREDFKQDDKLISFYSQEEGKVEILVRGARKIKSKLAPVISEPFALIKLKIVIAKDYYHLIGVDVQEHFKNIGLSYKKIIQTQYLLGRINAVLKTKKPDRKILLLLIAFLRNVNCLSETKVQVMFPGFLIKFLSFLGYRPEIKQCVVCHKLQQHKQTIYFDFKKGGIICQNHISDKENTIKISFKVFQVLQNLLYKDFAFLSKQGFSKKDLQTSQKIIEKFLDWHI